MVFLEGQLEHLAVLVVTHMAENPVYQAQEGAREGK